MEKTHTLTVDGRPVSVPIGATILEAARLAGAAVPTLCWHKSLDPIGSCRVCLVEVDGCEDPVTSCNTAAEPDMRVITDSPRLHELRRESLGYVLAHHPLDCPVCDKAGECRLQDLTYELGVSEPLFPIESDLNKDEIDLDWPLILRNDRRCIRCGRCVAICRQVQAVNTLAFAGRGISAHIDTVDGGPLNCEFCGQCLNVCPVGALLSKPFLHKARVWDLQSTETTCAFCGVGCGLRLEVRRNRIFRASAPENGPNRGLLCVRGTFGFGFDHNARRLGTPMRRQDDQLRPVSVENGLNAAADALSRVIRDSGPEAVAALGSARMTNEENALLARFMTKVIGSPHLDSPAGLGYRQALDIVAAGLGKAHDARIGELSCHDAILVLGADLAVEMPVASLEVLWASRRLDAELMVLTNRPTKLHEHATFAPLIAPGGEPAAALALIKWLVESGRFEEGFINDRTTGFAETKESLSRTKLEGLLRASGLLYDDLARIINALKQAERPLIVVGPEAYEAPAGASAVKGLVDLMLCAGLAEKEARILVTADRCNLRGAAQIARPDLMGAPGLDAMGIFNAAFKGRIKALLLFGVAPMTSFPNHQQVEAALEKLDCLVVCDPFLTGCASKATVVIPAATYASKRGTFTAADGTLRPVRPAIDPPENSSEDGAIIQELMSRLGGGLDATARETIPADLAKLPHYEGLTGEALKAGSWSPRARAPQRYQVQPIEIEPYDLEPPQGEGFIAIAAPMLFHNGTLSTHAVEGPGELVPEGFFAINAEDAAEIGVRDDDRIRLSATGSSIEGKLKIQPGLPRRMVLMPTHFPYMPPGRLISKGRVAKVRIDKI